MVVVVSTILHNRTAEEGKCQAEEHIIPIVLHNQSWLALLKHKNLLLFFTKSCHSNYRMNIIIRGKFQETLFSSRGVMVVILL